MKDSYGMKLTLNCATCGGIDFDVNDDKSYVKCETCNREYLGGYDEVLGYNQNEIKSATETLEKEVVKDADAELKKRLKSALRGKKNIKIR